MRPLLGLQTGWGAAGTASPALVLQGKRRGGSQCVLGSGGDGKQAISHY
jgi:hypothetical protein